MPAVVLLSGGLDSMVAAVHAARKGGLALALTIDYDQRSALSERKAAAAIAAHLKVEHRVVELPFFREIDGGALLQGEAKLPEVALNGLDDLQENRERASQVWVPNRNGLFINVAACYAEARGLDRIIVGFNREEAAAFPDNRSEFMEACTRALSFSLKRSVRVESPTIDLDKAGIVRLGAQLNAPFRHVWSCYSAGAQHCMACESCQRLKRALQSENLWDGIAQYLGVS